LKSQLFLGGRAQYIKGSNLIKFGAKACPRSVLSFGFLIGCVWARLFIVFFAFDTLLLASKQALDDPKRVFSAAISYSLTTSVP